jgi:hypothetical protein
MLTKKPYVEYLICTIGNSTSKNLAKHLDEVSHNVITDCLSDATSFGKKFGERM